jgi:hypothetical protein
MPAASPGSADGATLLPARAHFQAEMRVSTASFARLFSLHSMAQKTAGGQCKREPLEEGTMIGWSSTGYGKH